MASVVLAGRTGFVPPCFVPTGSMGVRFFGLVVVIIDTVCLLSCQVRRPDGEE